MSTLASAVKGCRGEVPGGILLPMSDKSARIAALIKDCDGRGLDAHYVAFFECFNRQWYYEAHEVLEKLWLPRRREPEALFYKGLIQLAGAFVHLQKGRPGPAISLLKLAATNLRHFSGIHEQLDVDGVLKLADAWLGRIEAGPESLGGFNSENAPKLQLLPDSQGAKK
jgi:predicted metal-dependent hydrolase